MIPRTPSVVADPRGKVSVVMPARDAASTLDVAVASVLDQGWRDLELLVVDDGSRDETRELARSWAARDVRVQVLELHGCGTAGARNAALDAATGRWVAFLDADDIWLPGKLEAQIPAMLHARVAASCTAYELMDGGGVPLRLRRSVPGTIDRRSLLTTCRVGCLTVVLDREALGGLRFPRVAKEDYALWFRVVDEAGPFLGVDRVLARYRRAKDSRTGRKVLEAPRQWQVYRDVLGLGRMESAAWMLSWAAWGVRKHLSST